MTTATANRLRGLDTATLTAALATLLQALGPALAALQTF